MERLNQDSLKTIDEIVERHRNEPGPVIVMLHDVQDSLGYVPFEAMEKIAEATGTSVADVYGVVCFYAPFTTSPKGKHVVNICLGTACYVKGAQALIDETMALTGAEINSTSENGIFSLDATRCLGACGLAPVCVIDGKVFGNCTKETITAEINKIKAAEKIA